MSLNLDFSPGSLHVVVHGTEQEISKVDDILLEHVGQSSVRTWQRIDGTSLQVLIGTALDIGMLPDTRILQPLVRSGASDLMRGGILRWYQAEAVVRAMEASHGHGVIRIPTGGGKTEVAAGIVACGILLGAGPWIYLCPSKSLAEQTERRFTRVLPKMLDTLQLDPDPDLWPVCTSFIAAKDEDLEAADGVIVDECHRIPADTFRVSVMKTSATRRIGLSATPLLRADKKNSLVTGLLGPTIFSVSMEQLVKDGHIVQGEIEYLDLEE